MKVEWLDSFREPQCEPDPDFPEGRDIDLVPEGRKSCYVPLPYPAKRCGAYVIKCEICGLRVGVTTAGRPDDPRSVKLECKLS